MAFKNAFTLLACSAWLLAASAASAQQVEGIAVVVNDEPITTLDVRDRMRLIISSAGIQPTEEMLEQIQDQAIRGLIEETLQLQTAREFDLQVDDAEVDESIQDIAERSGATVEEIERDLAMNGISIETLRRQLRAEIAWQILVGGRYRSRISISDQQIDQSLERLAQAAAQPQYRLAEILVEIRGSGGEERAIAILQTIFDQLNQGVPFPALAQQFSDAPSASSGGETGYLPASGLRPQVLEVVQQMPPGSISNPIRVPGGYQIVALIDRREGQIVEQFGLSQITLPPSRINDASRAALTRAVSRINGCDNLERAAGDVEGAIVTNLGVITANALIPRIRDALSGVETGQATSVIETPAGLQIFVICSREFGGPGMPSIDEVENQLINQQLSLLARRWLRDLRREATIEYR